MRSRTCAAVAVAFAQGMEARQGRDPQGLGAQPDSPTQRDAPKKTSPRSALPKTQAAQDLLLQRPPRPRPSQNHCSSSMTCSGSKTLSACAMRCLIPRLCSSNSGTHSPPVPRGDYRGLVSCSASGSAQRSRMTADGAPSAPSDSRKSTSLRNTSRTSSGIASNTLSTAKG